MTARETLLKKAADILGQPPAALDPAEVAGYVGPFIDRGPRFLKLCRREGTPLYAFDEAALLARARHFRAAFETALGGFRPYYAVKSNNHPAVSRTLVDLGFGLDVSSGQELEMALATGCGDIVFSGPGKTDEELALAVANAGRVTVLMDSFGELGRLESIAVSENARIRTGVRLTTEERGLWRKFGIPLSDLHPFFERAQACRGITLSGIQFHTSWNLDPAAQGAFIARLGRQLRQLPAARRAAIGFLDVGGGFWPARGEWLQPAGTPLGRMEAMFGVENNPMAPHYCCRSVPIEAFASAIAAAAAAHIFPHAPCRICAEPGRWLSDDAMHILLRVIDKKADDLVITDGGTNIIGWERFETDYAPVVNLSRPALEERACWILGSLCTPHDVWGYSYFGRGIEPGDILLIPSQGAYTYSLRQAFIKALPRVAALPA